jgi:hypothetical protein
MLDTMRATEDRNRQLAQQEMERRRAIQQDELARGVAGIYGEGAPTASTETTTEPNYGLSSGQTSFGATRNNSVEGLKRGGSLSGFAVPNASEIPSEREVARQVPAAPDTRQQRALRLAAQTPGGGQLAMQLAQGQMSGESAARKDHDAKADKVLELLAVGNVQGAKQYAEFYRLQDVLPMFNNPRAITSVQSLAAYAKGQGADVSQISAFVNTAMDAMSQGASYDEAFGAAYEQLVNSPGKIAHVTTDDAGNVTAFDARGRMVPVEGARGKSRAPRSGAVGGGSASVQRSFADVNGNMMALMKDGTVKQLVDAQGRPIRSSEISQFAGQVYLKAADMPGASMESARGIAGELYPGEQPPANSQPKVRRYVPGQGFVSN